MLWWKLSVPPNVENYVFLEMNIMNLNEMLDNSIWTLNSFNNSWLFAKNKLSGVRSNRNLAFFPLDCSFWRLSKFSHKNLAMRESIVTLLQANLIYPASM